MKPLLTAASSLPWAKLRVPISIAVFWYGNIFAAVLYLCFMFVVYEVPMPRSPMILSDDNVFTHILSYGYAISFWFVTWSSTGAILLIIVLRSIVYSLVPSRESKVTA